MNNFQVQFPELTNEDCTITISGDFITIEAMHFKVDLISFISKSKKDFVLDITDMTKMDLTALNALIVAQKEMYNKGKKFTIKTTRDSPIHELLHLTKFDQYLKLKIVAQS